MPRRNFRPAPAPVPVVTHVPAPPKTARPAGWTARTIELATRPGDSLTADAYVSPDGLTALHRGPETDLNTKADVPRYVVAAIVGGRAWAVIDVRNRRAATAAPVAQKAAAANAESADQLARMDSAKPGSRTWLDASARIRALYSAAGLI